MAQEYTTKHSTAQTATNDEEVIDLGRLVKNIWRGVKRFWVFGLLLLLVGGAGGLGYAQYTYSTVYDAYASFTIANSLAGEQTSSEISLATQMGKTFSYIVNSGVLKKVVAADLGLPSVGSKITATALTNTNIMTIHVQDSDPQRAYDVLNSVIQNYPTVAEYVIGSTKMTYLEDSGVPTAPMSALNRRRSIGQGMLIGLLVFGCWMLLFALTRTTMENADDVVALTNLDLLATFPRITMKKQGKGGSPKLLVNQKQISQSFVEATRLLANRMQALFAVQDAGQATGGKVVLVTSTLSGEGKSTVAANLALVLAKRGQKILLIDTDIHKPSLAGLFNITAPAGTLNSVLSGKTKFAESLVKNPKYPLFLLPSEENRSTQRWSTKLTNKVMRRLLKTARSACDYIILDTAPAKLFADAASLAGLADATVFVIKQDYAQQSEVLESISTLEDAGTKMAGFVLNGSYVNESKYGYGYGYGYGNIYGYGKDKKGISNYYSNLPNEDVDDEAEFTFKQDEP